MSTERAFGVGRNAGLRPGEFQHLPACRLQAARCGKSCSAAKVYAWRPKSGTPNKSRSPVCPLRRFFFRIQEALQVAISCGMAQLAQRLGLDLPNALAR